LKQRISFSKTIYPTKYRQPKKPFGMQMCVTQKNWFRESLKKMRLTVSWELFVVSSNEVDLKKE